MANTPAKKCAACERPFSAERDWHVFCSAACRAEFWRVQQARPPRTRGTRVEVQCEPGHLDAVGILQERYDLATNSAVWCRAVTEMLLRIGGSDDPA